MMTPPKYFIVAAILFFQLCLNPTLLADFSHADSAVDEEVPEEVENPEVKEEVSDQEKKLKEINKFLEEIKKLSKEQRDKLIDAYIKDETADDLLQLLKNNKDDIAAEFKDTHSDFVQSLEKKLTPPAENGETAPDSASDSDATPASASPNASLSKGASSASNNAAASATKPSTPSPSDLFKDLDQKILSLQQLPQKADPEKPATPSVSSISQPAKPAPPLAATKPAPQNLEQARPQVTVPAPAQPPVSVTAAQVKPAPSPAPPYSGVFEGIALGGMAASDSGFKAATNYFNYSPEPTSSPSLAQKPYAPPPASPTTEAQHPIADDDSGVFSLNRTDSFPLSSTDREIATTPTVFTGLPAVKSGGSLNPPRITFDENFEPGAAGSGNQSLAASSSPSGDLDLKNNGEDGNGNLLGIARGATLGASAGLDSDTNGGLSANETAQEVASSNTPPVQAGDVFNTLFSFAVNGLSSP